MPVIELTLAEAKCEVEHEIKLNLMKKKHVAT